MAFLFLTHLEDSDSAREDDVDTVVATSVAVGETTIGEDVVGVEIFFF